MFPSTWNKPLFVARNSLPFLVSINSLTFTSLSVIRVTSSPLTLNAPWFVAIHTLPSLVSMNFWTFTSLSGIRVALSSSTQNKTRSGRPIELPGRCSFVVRSRIHSHTFPFLVSINFRISIFLSVISVALSPSTRYAPFLVDSHTFPLLVSMNFRTCIFLSVIRVALFPSTWNTPCSVAIHNFPSLVSLTTETSVSISGIRTTIWAFTEWEQTIIRRKVKTKQLSLLG